MNLFNNLKAFNLRNTLIGQLIIMVLYSLILFSFGETYILLLDSNRDFLLIVILTMIGACNVIFLNVELVNERKSILLKSYLKNYNSFKRINVILTFVMSWIFSIFAALIYTANNFRLYKLGFEYLDGSTFTKDIKGFNQFNVGIAPYQYDQNAILFAIVTVTLILSLLYICFLLWDKWGTRIVFTLGSIYFTQKYLDMFLYIGKEYKDSKLMPLVLILFFLFLGLLVNKFSEEGKNTKIVSYFSWYLIGFFFILGSISTIIILFFYSFIFLSVEKFILVFDIIALLITIGILLLRHKRFETIFLIIGAFVAAGFVMPLLNQFNNELYKNGGSSYNLELNKSSKAKAYVYITGIKGQEPLKLEFSNVYAVKEEISQYEGLTLDEVYGLYEGGNNFIVSQEYKEDTAEYSKEYIGDYVINSKNTKAMANFAKDNMDKVVEEKSLYNAEDIIFIDVESKNQNDKEYVSYSDLSIQAIDQPKRFGKDLTKDEAKEIDEIISRSIAKKVEDANMVIKRNSQYMSLYEGGIIYLNISTEDEIRLIELGKLETAFDPDWYYLFMVGSNYYEFEE